MKNCSYLPLFLLPMREDQNHLLRRIGMAILLALGMLTADAEDWTTTDGKTFKEVSVISHNESAVTIRCSEGIFTFAVSHLGKDLQKRLSDDLAAAGRSTAEGAPGTAHPDAPQVTPEPKPSTVSEPLAPTPGQPKKGPIQVFILAGQSNMEGQGMVTAKDEEGHEKPGTLASLLHQPGKASLLQHLVDAQGNWTEKRENVWVYDVNEFGSRHGVLEFGYGWSLGSRDWFGPELGFGHMVADHLDGPILIIKTAWGGKSLYKDFRPPSSGGEQGPSYGEMIATVNKVLGDLKGLYPDYDGRDYHLAGFVWWQGWNDYCNREGPPEYEANLVNLIKDIRHDLKAPNLPVVVGEFTGPWGADCHDDAAVAIRTAQKNAAARPEFAGTVQFVETHDFVRTQQESPTDEGYHEFKNGETYLLIGQALGTGMLQLLNVVPAQPPKPSAPVKAQPKMTGFGTGNWGHLMAFLTGGTDDYRAGFSLYAAAWPLLEKNLPDYQSGLMGTWIYPAYKKPDPHDVYNSMEGGLGWWQNTRFLTLPPKFSMGGVAGDFGQIANSPNWADTPGKLGIAQLSPWLLVPPDGINLRKETNGELFGYGYFALPLSRPKETTAGQAIPTGNQCWTLFLNTANFKGPVAFFTPYFWSRASLRNPEMIGQGLDTRPGANGDVGMEAGSTPRFLSTDSNGVFYSRIPIMNFPVDEKGQSVLVHNVTRYSRQALWDNCETWFAGGPAAGPFAASGILLAHAKGLGIGLQQWSDQNKEVSTPVKGLKRVAAGAALDATTWGLQWQENAVRNLGGGKRQGSFPEYYRSANQTWEAVDPGEVPNETGLKEVSFDYGVRKDPPAYIAPDEPDSCWKIPGPKAGPFLATLNDGSVVTYYWYRFVDQPTLQNADLSEEDKTRLQAVVEKIHRAWTIDRDYLPPPTRGTLAGLDPALIVHPPPGLEVGYVPVVTRQESVTSARAASVLEQEQECSTDSFGKKFKISQGIRHYKSPEPVEGGRDPNDFLEQVYGGNFTLSVNGLPEGRYTIEIELAETYRSDPGRIMNITSGKTELAKNLDVFVAAGGANKMFKVRGTVDHRKDSIDSPIKIHFVGLADNAFFNAIHILDAMGNVVAGTAAADFADTAEIKASALPTVTDPPVYQDADQPVDLRIDDLIRRMSLKEKVRQMVNGAPAIKRLGLPAYDYWNEALHGVAREGPATVFPQAIGLAAMWDTGLERQIGTIIGIEGRAKYNDNVRHNKRGSCEGLTFWSPNINIFRDPRWGRGQETYGEDPFLTSQMAVAFIQGLQGNDPKYMMAMACAKHFAVHSGPEPARHSFDARVSQDDLHNTYLPQFEAAVREGQVGGIMSAYNAINGVAAPANAFLLQDHLRNKWGFAGYVVSDCDAINDIYAGHHLVPDAETASAMAVKAGTDLDCGQTYYSLFRALNRGLLSDADIDHALHHALWTRFRLGLFDPPERVPFSKIDLSEVNSPAHQAVALQAARESIVLLKNEGALPLDANWLKKIAVVGANAADTEMLHGNYNGDMVKPISILQGIKDAAGSRIKVTSFPGCPLALTKDDPFSENSPDFQQAVQGAADADVIIYVGGINSGLEGEEMNVKETGFSGGDRTTIQLPPIQTRMLQALVATGKPVILINCSGSAMAMPWEVGHVPAIIQAWYPGQAGGTAVADVLFGRYNPTGRLPVTFYASDEDLPDFSDYSMVNRTYRYFAGQPQYPFGFGLSYTKFDYAGLQISPEVSATGNVELKLIVTNSGKYDGEEVVQVYYRNTNKVGGSPIRSLCAFQRVAIPCGLAKTLEFEVPVRNFRHWNESRHDYVVDPGTYEIQVGAFAGNVRLKGLVQID